jgi:predicted amidohydrolase YtcJ
MGSLSRLGTRLSFGSDWSVSSLRPLDGIAVAVSRQTAEGEPPGGWLPDERLPLDVALAAYTSGTAWQAFEEDEAGTIAIGKRADLCLLGTDPGTVEGHSVGEIPVVATWLGGVEVFRQ